MKTRRRTPAFWAVSLACLNSLACFSSFDPSKIECVSDPTCPSGYVCSRTPGQDHGTCVSKGQNGGTSDGPLASPVDGSSAPDRATYDSSQGDSGWFVDGPIGAEGTAETGTSTPPKDGPSADAADVPTNAGPEAGTSTDATDAPAGSGPEVSSSDVSTTLPNGSACTVDLQCTNAHCVDGICCNTQCDGQCESCAESGSTGTCKVRTGAPIATRTACSGSGTCKGQCDGSTKSCVYAGSSTVCTQASCVNGSASPASNCDGAGNCPAVTASQCAGDLCASDGSGKCAASCTATSCSAGTYCSAAGACAPKKTPGTACSSTAECTTGICVDGVCCNTACTGQCQVCNTTGTCVNNSSGAPVGGRGACTGAGTACGGTCDGTTDGCVYPGVSKSCGTATCSSDLTMFNWTACNGLGACSSPQTTSCGTADYCSGGACTTKLTSGACQSNTQCQSGNCSIYSVTGTSICCQSGYSNCGSCSYLQTDPANCGSCGNKCGPNRTCSNGSCSCAGYAFTCGGCGSWNFESGTTESWAIGYDAWATDNYMHNGVVNALPTSSVVHGGSSHALAATLSMDGTSIIWAAIAVPLCQTNGVNLAGFTLSFYVYFAGPAFSAPMANSISADAWNASQNSVDTSTGVNGLYQTATNTWVPILLNFPTVMTQPMDHLDIRFASGVPWNGTMYLDDIQLSPP